MCTQRTAYSGASLHSDKGKIIVVNLDQLRILGGLEPISLRTCVLLASYLTARLPACAHS